MNVGVGIEIGYGGEDLLFRGRVGEVRAEGDDPYLLAAFLLGADIRLGVLAGADEDDREAGGLAVGGLDGSDLRFQLLADRGGDGLAVDKGGCGVKRWGEGDGGRRRRHQRLDSRLGQNKDQGRDFMEYNSYHLLERGDKHVDE